MKADVENKDVIYHTWPATKMQIADSTWTSYDRLCSALLPACQVLDIPFQELFEALENSGNAISERLCLVPSDTQFNTIGAQGQNNADYDLLSIET